MLDRRYASGLSEFHCYVCKKYYPAYKFYADRTRSSGLQSKCRVCCDERRSQRSAQRVIYLGKGGENV